MEGKKSWRKEGALYTFDTRVPKLISLEEPPELLLYWMSSVAIHLSTCTLSPQTLDSYKIYNSPGNPVSMQLLLQLRLYNAYVSLNILYTAAGYIYVLHTLRTYVTCGSSRTASYLNLHAVASESSINDRSVFASTDWDRACFSTHANTCTEDDSPSPVH